MSAKTYAEIEMDHMEKVWGHAKLSNWPTMSPHYDKVLDVIGLGISAKEAFLMSNKELERELKKPVVDYTTYTEMDDGEDWA